MNPHAGRDERGGLRRLRWRVRGAWLWPTFAVVTLLEMLLLHRLPLAGDDTSPLEALLLAGCLNVLAVASIGGIGGAVLRHRRPDLPKVVADNYAGTAALVAVAAAFAVAGLAHRPAIADEHAAFAAHSTAVRRWVEANGDAFTRAHVNAATALRVDAGLYRTCVPGPDPKRWLCLFVDTSRSPPLVRQDRSHESNAAFNPRGGFR